MKLAYTTIVCWATLLQITKSELKDDADLSPQDIALKYGYPFEIHHDILTEDGYLLDVFRIPHGRTKGNDSKGAVLLMHGLLGGARDFISFGPERSLAFLLADRGYDVWLGNNRGTAHSRKHPTLNPDVDEDYWDFSWHEIGLYDLPAIFSLIRNVTKKEAFSYIGLSQGTTVYYVLMSVRPEYNSYINIMISLAPVAYMGHMISPIFRTLSLYEPFLASLAKSLGVNEIPPKPFGRFLVLLGKRICGIEGPLQEICAHIFFLICGYDEDQFDKNTLITMVSGNISASTRQLFHYAQNINSGLFRQFSFGNGENLIKYGSLDPPSYNLSKISSPVAVFYAEHDWLAHVKDVQHLYRQLPKCVRRCKVKHQMFNHLDFICARDVITLVFNDVFKLLDKYNRNWLDNFGCNTL